MSSRDKDTKLLQDMLKVFFKKGSSAPVPARNELVVTAELERELGPEAPPPRRLRALKDLADRALTIRMPEGAVTKLWTCMRDLLDDPNVESRHAALSFLCSVAEGQGDELHIMRTIFFRYLKETHPNHPPEDSQLRFKLLYTLTNSGKNIKCFEEQIGAFLLEWLPQIQSPQFTVEFLQLIINVVKFNATYLDEDIVQGIVNSASRVCSFVCAEEAVVAALSLLEAVLSYSLLPRAALPALVHALCRAANQELHCHAAWKLMRSMLGADIGPATLATLCRSLRAGGAGGAGGAAGAGGAGGEAGVLRGAVFFVGAALWGPRRVHALAFTPLAVLPALLKVLDAEQPVVTYEVVLALQSLLARAAAELREPAWDLLLRIIRRLLDQDKKLEPANELIHNGVHALLTSVEQLQEAGQYCGDDDELLQLLDYCGHDRPEASTMRVVTLRAARLSAGEGGAGVLALAERYVRLEHRPAVRLHALAALVRTVRRDSAVLGWEGVERAGAALLGAAATDADAALRAAAATALADLAAATIEPATDLVDLLDKILNRPFEMYVGEVAVPAGADTSDVALAAGGLLRLLQRPAAPATAARALAALLDHLEEHYRRPAIFLHHPAIRLKILEMVFAVRVNSFNCIGFCYDSSGAVVSGAAAARLRPLCCPLLLSEPPARPLPGAVVAPVGRLARVLGLALSREAEWRVLGAVVRALPGVLHARAPAAGRRRDVDALAGALCALLARPADRVPLSEVHQAALPALAALAPHHAALDPNTQQRAVRCLLKYGMVLRSPQPYINALTLFTLEMRDTMVKLLPEVLLDLSKISDTKAIASPMLEFLSTLTRLPAVFASFVEDQYMSVFAIVLPYTNPSRYNHYVVSLAHHVIAAWFLKCRLSYRRNFVRFIIHGLHNYIIMPFEEQLQYKTNHFQQTNVNEDSSNRQRSSSLGSKAVSRAPMGRAGGAGAGGASASAAFHVELTEACVDLLARYTTTAVSVKPHRSELSEFLLSGGQSMTWLVGHKLVTVTTSGCLQNSIKQGPCDRCAVLCRQHAESFADVDPGSLQVPATDTSGSDTPEIKRYSKRSLQHSRSSDTSASSDLPPPSRQNSAENSKSSDAADGLNQFPQKFDRIPKEPEGEDSWSRWGGGGGGGGGGGCPCWCARWAEVTVRAAAGDTAFVMRAQNDLAAAPDHMHELAALLAPPAPRTPHHEAGEARSRSGSASAAPDLTKSSSDTVVWGEKKPPHAASHCIGPPPHRLSTQPINIPGSPQRQSSSSTTDDDDLLLQVPEGKSRAPVRRSNSSPEMSSSWKERHTPDDLLLLPPDTPAPASAAAAAASSSAAASLHLSKKAAKKSDMRVSCEAIPEEMSGTSPHLPHLPHLPPHTPQSPHPHLMTYNSDPGKVDDEQTTDLASSHHQLQKTASDSTVTSGAHKPPAPPRPPPAPAPAPAPGDPDDLPPLSRSKRSHTISVMSPTRRHRDSVASRGSGASASGSGGGGGGSSGGGLTPAFVFLQLYHNMSTYPVAPPVPGEAPTILNPLSERPLRVCGVQHERTIKNLDLVPPLDTYKVGVLYVGPGQHDNEVAILRNEYGSLRYSEFLCGLGALVPLDGQPPPHLFLNLEPGGRDGAYTYVWHDDIMQVLFHVATAMPSLASDPTCNEKRKYIGNDYVSIVYNDSDQDFNIHTIKGQFNFCIVVVEPYEHGLNRVLLKTKDEMLRSKFLAHVDTLVVSDGNVALLARQLALHAALASQIWQSLKVGGAPYASNSLERLRLIKRLRRRLEAERLAAAARPAPYQPPATDLALRVAGVDFNAYT